MKRAIIVNGFYKRCMWRRLFCWRGKPSKSKGSGILGRICGCAFAVGWGEIGFRLPWWGKENERFGKRFKDSIVL